MSVGIEICVGHRASLLSETDRPWMDTPTEFFWSAETFRQVGWDRTMEKRDSKPFADASLFTHAENRAVHRNGFHSTDKQTFKQTTSKSNRSSTKQINFHKKAFHTKQIKPEIGKCLTADVKHHGKLSTLYYPI